MWHQCRYWTAESNFIQCPLYEVMQRRYLLLQAWIPPQKNHLQFDDFPSKSQGNWRVVHLSAAERRSGRFYQKGNIFSFVRSRPFLWCCFLCCGKIFINTTARPEGDRFAVGAAAAAAHVSSYEPPMSQSLGSAFSYLISLGNYFLCLPVCLALFLQAKTPPLSSLNRPTENWKNVSTLCPSFVPQNFFHFDRKKLNKISLTTIGGWCGWNKWPLRWPSKGRNLSKVHRNIFSLWRSMLSLNQLIAKTNSSDSWTEKSIQTPCCLTTEKLVCFSSDFNEISSAGSSCIYLQLYFWVRVDGKLKSAANLR